MAARPRYIARIFGIIALERAVGLGAYRIRIGNDPVERRLERATQLLAERIIGGRLWRRRPCLGKVGRIDNLRRTMLSLLSEYRVVVIECC